MARPTVEGRVELPGGTWRPGTKVMMTVVGYRGGVAYATSPGAAVAGMLEVPVGQDGSWKATNMRPNAGSSGDQIDDPPESAYMLQLFVPPTGDELRPQRPESRIFVVPDEEGPLDVTLLWADSPTMPAVGDLIWSWVLARDGAGSGLDADLLDGEHGSFYASAEEVDQRLLTYTRLRDVSQALVLDGASGSYAWSDDVPNVTSGDLDMRWWGIVELPPVNDPPGPPAISMAFMGRWGTGNQRESQMRWQRPSSLPDGGLQLRTSHDGTAPAVAGPLELDAVVSGEPFGVRMTRNTDGDITYEIWDFDTETWDVIRSEEAVLEPGTLHESTARFEIGASASGAADMLIGRVHRAEVYDSIDGNLIASPDFTDPSLVGASQFTDDQGNVWHLEGAAAIEAADVQLVTDSEAVPVVVAGSLPARWHGQRNVSVATRANPPGRQNTLSDGIATAATYRVAHVATATCRGLRLAWGNWYNTGGIEKVGPNNITVSASLESSGGQLFPVTFSGRLECSIEPGGTVWCDPIGFEVTQGEKFWTRTFVSVSTPGEKWPIFTCSARADDGEGHNEGSPGADLTQEGDVPVVDEAPLLGPFAIQGSPSPRPVVGVVGDSISVGANDTGLDSGPFVRAFGSALPYQRIGFGGATIHSFVNSRYCLRRWPLLTGCTHVISEVGVNDADSSSSSVITQLQELWTVLRREGFIVYQTTITPISTSTDGWETVENQTPVDDATIQAVNTFIRSVPKPLAGVFDFGAAVESSPGSGVWAAGYSHDGIHPTPIGAAAMADAIDLTVFWS